MQDSQKSESILVVALERERVLMAALDEKHKEDIFFRGKFKQQR